MMVVVAFTLACVLIVCTLSIVVFIATESGKRGAKWSLYLTGYNHPYSSTVDQFINELLDTEPAIVGISYASVDFEFKDKIISIWIANRWYAFASEASYVSRSSNIPAALGKYVWSKKRPSRRTMYRLYEYIKEPLKSLDVVPSLSTLVGEAAATDDSAKAATTTPTTITKKLN